MSLIKCKECGKEYSNKANACPNCACPTSYNEEAKDKQEMDNIVCSECGAIYERRLYACPNCGCPTEQNQNLQEVEGGQNSGSSEMENISMTLLRAEDPPAESPRERIMQQFSKNSFTTSSPQDNLNNEDESLIENPNSKKESSLLRNRNDGLKGQDEFGTEQIINASRLWEKSNDSDGIIKTDNHLFISGTKWRRSFKLGAVTFAVVWVLVLMISYYYLEFPNGKGYSLSGALLGFLIGYLTTCIMYWAIAFITFAIRKKGTEKRTISSSVIGDLSIMTFFGLFITVGIVYSGGVSLQLTTLPFSAITFGLFSYWYHRNRKEKARPVK